MQVVGITIDNEVDSQLERVLELGDGYSVVTLDVCDTPLGIIEFARQYDVGYVILTMGGPAGGHPLVAFVGTTEKVQALVIAYAS